MSMYVKLKKNRKREEKCHKYESDSNESSKHSSDSDWQSSFSSRESRDLKVGSGTRHNLFF